jgi:hypothetical protein
MVSASLGSRGDVVGQMNVSISTAHTRTCLEARLEFQAGKTLARVPMTARFTAMLEQQLDPQRHKPMEIYIQLI